MYVYVLPPAIAKYNSKLVLGYVIICKHGLQKVYGRASPMDNHVHHGQTRRLMFRHHVYQPQDILWPVHPLLEFRVKYDGTQACNAIALTLSLTVQLCLPKKMGTPSVIPKTRRRHAPFKYQKHPMRVHMWMEYIDISRGGMLCLFVVYSLRIHALAIWIMIPFRKKHESNNTIASLAH
jgi:hypothetical protein